MFSSHYFLTGEFAIALAQPHRSTPKLAYGREPRQIDLAVARSFIQTSIVSVLQLTAALLPTLKPLPESTIITTSSGLAFVPGPISRPTAPVRRFSSLLAAVSPLSLRDTSVEV